MSEMKGGGKALEAGLSALEQLGRQGSAAAEERMRELGRILENMLRGHGGGTVAPVGMGGGEFSHLPQLPPSHPLEICNGPKFLCTIPLDPLDNSSSERLHFLVGFHVEDGKTTVVLCNESHGHLTNMPNTGYALWGELDSVPKLAEQFSEGGVNVVVATTQVNKLSQLPGVAAKWPPAPFEEPNRGILTQCADERIKGLKEKIAAHEDQIKELSKVMVQSRFARPDSNPELSPAALSEELSKNKEALEAEKIRWENFQSRLPGLPSQWISPHQAKLDIQAPRHAFYYVSV